MSEYEKILFRYSCALEDRDWKTIGEIYARAENDPSLLREIEALDEAHRSALSLPAIDIEKAQHLEKDTLKGQFSQNGFAHANPQMAIDPVSKAQTTPTSQRGTKMLVLRIAVLIATLLSGALLYIEHLDDTLIFSEDISETGLAGQEWLQTEREVITTGNIERLKLLQRFERPAGIDGAFWLNNDTQYAVYSPEAITVYDAETREQTHVFMPEKRIRQVIGNDANQIVAVLHGSSDYAVDRELALYDLAADELLYTIPIPGERNLRMAFSPDGNYLALAADTPDASNLPIYVWSVADGTQHIILNGLKDELQAISFSPNGEHLFASGLVERPPELAEDNSRLIPAIFFWDLSTGEQIYRLIGFSEVTAEVRLTPDASRLVAIQSFGEANIWNLNLENAPPISPLQPVSDAYTTPDISTEFESSSIVGVNILGFDDGDMILIQGLLGTEQEYFRYSLDTLEVQSSGVLVSLKSNPYSAYIPSKDGEQALVLGKDTLSILRIGPQTLLHTQPIMHRGAGHSELAISSDGSQLAVPFFTRLELVDTATGDVIAQTQIFLAEALDGLAFDPHEPIIYFSDNVLVALSSSSQMAEGIVQTPLFRWDLREDQVRSIAEAGLAGPIQAMDENTFLYSMLSHGLYRVELSNGEVLDITRLDADIARTSKSRLALGNERLFYSVGTRELFIYDLATDERQSFLAHADTIADMSISQDRSTLVTLDQSGNIKLWDTATLENIATWTHTAQTQRFQAEVSLDNRLIAVGDETGIHFWDATTNEVLNTLPDLTNSFLFSEDGTLFITLEDGDILFWGVPAEQ